MVTALLVSALAGFLLLSITHLSRYWLNRQSGYKLFFATAAAGGLLMVTARCLVVFVIDPAFFSSSWDEYAPFELSKTLAVTVILAVLMASIINLVVDSNSAARLIARTSGDLIECLLEDVKEQNGLVELTMENGKVYVGLPRESGVAVTGESDIAVVPLISGYRDEGRKTFNVTTHYAKTLKELTTDGENELSFDDFQVFLPMSEVKSARLFDPLAYRMLQDPNYNA